jgi:hypothetical protein
MAYHPVNLLYGLSRRVKAIHYHCGSDFNPRPVVAISRRVLILRKKYALIIIGAIYDILRQRPDVRSKCETRRAFFGSQGLSLDYILN